MKSNFKYLSATDLAGEVCFNPNFWQTKARIHNLLDTYLTQDILCERLEDLPEQFLNPQPRPWRAIQWQNISQELILGIEFQTFLSVIKGTLDTEAPIRGYTQTSRQYLASIHPAMARFVGGVVGKDNSLLELGLWEKEERQHTPALVKVYQQLSQAKVIPRLRSPKTYQPSGNAKMDLYVHGLHRIATEYSAVCLYLWLMARTTDSLQAVFQELLQDEINHLTKFWGFGQWLYTDRNFLGLSSLKNYQYHERQSNYTQVVKHLTVTITRMMRVLHWEFWSLTHKIELIYTFICVWQRMRFWSKTLTVEYLSLLFASSLISENDLIDPTSIYF